MTEITGFTLRLLFFIALYIFLGIAVWMLWKNVAGKDQKSGNIAIPTITLATNLHGDQKVQAFNSSEVLIGRDSECDFVLLDPTVSARHGRLAYHLNQWWFEDLKSTNGSYLDNLRIEEPIVVKDNDNVSCGDVIFRIYIKPLD